MVWPRRISFKSVETALDSLFFGGHSVRHFQRTDDEDFGDVANHQNELPCFDGQGFVFRNGLASAERILELNLDLTGLARFDGSVNGPLRPVGLVVDNGASVSSPAMAWKTFPTTHMEAIPAMEPAVMAGRAP